MSSQIESGHAKTVANFEQLISYVTGYGAIYNPAKTAIKLTGLQTLLTNSRTALSNVNSKVVTCNNAVNSRIIAFAGIKKLATRLLSALFANGATNETVMNAKTINRKIQGSRAKLIIEPVVKTVLTDSGPASLESTARIISVSQQSFDSLVEHLSKLVALLSSETSYAPNEADLKVAALNTLVTNLRANNTAVLSAQTNVSNTRISRDSILYHPSTGLCEIAKEVKLYVKSIYGSASPQFRQISGIKFKSAKI